MVIVLKLGDIVKFGKAEDLMIENKTMHIPTDLEVIIQCLQDHSITPILVGGCTRDTLMNQPTSDYDIEVYGHDITHDTLRACLEPIGTVIEVGKIFGVIKIRPRNSRHVFDIALPRLEKKVGKGHKGFQVMHPSGIDYKTAAARRDFTINSIGYNPLTDSWLDPFGGRQDIENKILRHVSNAFSEDPLRVYRAIQFSARFNFKIAEETQKICMTMPLDELPKERIFDEFKKWLLQAKRPSIGFRWLHKLGIVQMFPELEALIGVPQEPEWHPEGDVWTHTLMVVDEMATMRNGSQDDIVLMLAALCHDFGKPCTTAFIDGRWRSRGHEEKGVDPTRSFLNQLTNDKALINAVLSLVKHHLKPALLFTAQKREKVTDAAIRRLSTKVYIPHLLKLAQADHFGRNTPDAIRREFPAGEWLRQRAQGLKVSHKPPEQWITGKQLLSLGIAPGPEMGKLIKAAYNAQLNGEIATKEEAIPWVEERMHHGHH